ncbi:hypothetical protein [uncultured Capnocytophaga sp.]|uniref:hypothetical protein n=1 Tax=uncultured Capnocytophaga sp. TaxID=159273 RepID=UPI0026283075|nr:hypothetical protein [uncultured Capnocytophaga sp.]
MKMLNLYLQELGNVFMEIISSISSVFSDTPIMNNEAESKIRTKEDRQRFQEAINELKKSENKDQSKTILLSNNQQMTIVVR